MEFSNQDTNIKLILSCKNIPINYHFPTLSELNHELEAETHNMCATANLEALDTINTSINKITGTDHPSESKEKSLTLFDAPPSSLQNAQSLIAEIIQSDDKLFFINHINSGRKEWNLVQVNLEKTFAHNPHVFSDGKFLVEYYVAHPDDSNYGAINKRYWKEYHAKLGRYQLHEKYHIIKPTISEEKYCLGKSLIPYETWSYIGRENIFIHGPFNFATLNGRKKKIEFQNLTGKINSIKR